MSDDMTIKSMFETLDEFGGDIAQIIKRDKNDNPIDMVLVVKGKESTQDVIDAIDKLKEKWDSE